MASLRMLKRDINYLMDEVVTDSYLSMYFNPERKDAIVEIMKDAVEMRNSLYDRANRPAEKKNAVLVRRHYAALRREMLDGIDGLFQRLSEVNK